MNNITTLPLGILEEIGFEGLEGITIEGLWKRLSVRLKLSLPLNDKLKNEVWKFIQNAKCLQFYKLPKEREPLKLLDRTELADPFFEAIRDSIAVIICFFHFRNATLRFHSKKNASFAGRMSVQYVQIQSD